MQHETLTAAQIMADPRVKELVEVLEAKTILDASNSNSTWLDAKARAAIAQLKEA
jgi:hypothetical protein